MKNKTLAEIGNATKQLNELLGADGECLELEKALCVTLNFDPANRQNSKSKGLSFAAFQHLIGYRRHLLVA